MRIRSPGVLAVAVALAVMVTAGTVPVTADPGANAEAPTTADGGANAETHPTADVGADAECGSRFDLDAPTLYLPASENATVTGGASLDPGENTSIVLRSGDSSSSVVARNDSVVIDRNGDWEATVDLSGVEEGRRFVATLSNESGVVGSVEGEVGTPTANVTFENQTAFSSNSVVVRAALETGGFVAVRVNSTHGPVVGVSDYVAPGSHDSVSVELDETFAGSRRLVAVLHRDTDCDGAFGFLASPVDRPYLENGTPVADAATVDGLTTTPTATPKWSLPTPTPTPSPTPVPSTHTATPTASPSTPDVASPTTPPEGTTVPGFGVGAALLALVAGVTLLRRNR